MFALTRWRPVRPEYTRAGVYGKCVTVITKSNCLQWVKKYRFHPDTCKICLEPVCVCVCVCVCVDARATLWEYLNSTQWWPILCQPCGGKNQPRRSILTMERTKGYPDSSFGSLSVWVGACAHVCNCMCVRLPLEEDVTWEIIHSVEKECQTEDGLKFKIGVITAW